MLGIILFLINILKIVSEMDWDALEQRKVRPPFKPRVVSQIVLSIPRMIN